MDKKIICSFLFLFIFAIESKAQVYLDSLNKQGNEMVNAAVNGDYKTLLKYTHPKIIKIMGGNDQALITLKQTMNALKEQNFIIQKAGIGKIVQMIKTKKNFQCIIPQTVTLKLQNKTAESNNFLFAISYNNGLRWYFLDTGGASENQIRKIFTEMDKNLIIPKSKTTYH